MENIETLIKHPVVILIALALVGVSSITNFKFATDPSARPDPYTGSQAERLETDLSNQIQENRDDIDVIREANRRIREEQVIVLQRLKVIEKQINENTKDLGSRKNQRWNYPDMINWIENTEAINENWRGANPVKNGR